MPGFNKQVFERVAEDFRHWSNGCLFLSEAAC